MGYVGVVSYPVRLGFTMQKLWKGTAIMDAHWPLQKIGRMRRMIAETKSGPGTLVCESRFPCWVFAPLNGFHSYKIANLLLFQDSANQTGAGVRMVNLHLPTYSNRCSLSTPCRIEIIWKTCISNMKWLELDQSKKSVCCEWHSDASDNRDSPESLFAKAARAWLACSPVRIRNDERWRIYSNHIDWMGLLMWRFLSCGKWSRENICNMSSH